MAARQVPADLREPSDRNTRLTLSLRTSSSTIVAGSPLAAVLVLQPLDGPVDLLVSRPLGARSIGIVDDATGASVPTRVGHFEVISMVHTERISRECPLIITVDLHEAFDLKPGTYIVRGGFGALLPADSEHPRLILRPELTSNAVTVTVT